jgi:hypothetical protein
MTLADDFRSRAEEQRESAHSLLGAVDIETSASKRITAVVGFVNASTLEALADLADYLRQGVQLTRLSDRQRKALEKNDAIRIAAATGDWNRFDELISERGAAGSDGTEGGNPSPGDDGGS